MNRFILIPFILSGLLFMTSCESTKKSGNDNGGGTIKVNEFVFNYTTYLVREGKQSFYGAKYGQGTKCVNLLLGSRLTGFYITVDLIVKTDRLEKGTYSYKKDLNSAYLFGNAKIIGKHINGGNEVNITGTTITVSFLDDGRYKIIFNCITDVEDKSSSASGANTGNAEKEYLTLKGVFVGTLPWDDTTAL